MDVLEAIKNRRSVRKYTTTPVTAQQKEKILEAAEWAPSAGNQQAREVIVVENKDTREKLAKAAYGQDFIAHAPLVIIVCSDPVKSARCYGSRGRDLYAIQDAAAAAQNILLASQSLGLGSCWVGAFSEQQVREILAIPKEVIPVALIPIGAADEKPKPPGRKISVRKEKW